MARLIDPSEAAERVAERVAASTITLRLDPESMAILERLALALEALVKQQGGAQEAAPVAPAFGPFLREE